MDKKICSELAFVFSQLQENHLSMVPNEIQTAVVENADTEIINKFDSEKPFTEQDLSEETLQILTEIFKNVEEII